jgi:hypothetical protein
MRRLAITLAMLASTSSAYATGAWSCDEDSCAGSSDNGAWAYSAPSPRIIIVPAQRYYVPAPAPQPRDDDFCYDLDRC